MHACNSNLPSVLLPGWGLITMFLHSQTADCKCESHWELPSWQLARSQHHMRQALMPSVLPICTQVDGSTALCATARLRGTWHAPTTHRCRPAWQSQPNLNHPIPLAKLWGWHHVVPRCTQCKRHTHVRLHGSPRCESTHQRVLHYMQSAKRCSCEASKHMFFSSPKTANWQLEVANTICDKPAHPVCLSPSCIESTHVQASTALSPSTRLRDV